MARLKQTARKSTGGMRPSKQLLASWDNHGDAGDYGGGGGGGGGGGDGGDGDDGGGDGGDGEGDSGAAELSYDVETNNRQIALANTFAAKFAEQFKPAGGAAGGSDPPPRKKCKPANGCKALKSHGGPLSPAMCRGIYRRAVQRWLTASAAARATRQRTISSVAWR